MFCVTALWFLPSPLFFAYLILHGTRDKPHLEQPLSEELGSSVGDLTISLHLTEPAQPQLEHRISCKSEIF